MHCSSFRHQLDAYVDLELSPVKNARMADHASTCAECASLLEELRVIDGLLLEPRRLEPKPNFTFAVMAEARSMHAPRAHRSLHLPVLATYIVFGWVAIAGFLIFGGRSAHAMLAMLGVWAGEITSGFGTLSGLTAHLFGRQSFDVTAAMGALIAIDLLGVAAVFAVYSRLRVRRASLQGNSD